MQRLQCTVGKDAQFNGIITFLSLLEHWLVNLRGVILKGAKLPLKPVRFLLSSGSQDQT